MKRSLLSTVVAALALGASGAAPAADPAYRVAPSASGEIAYDWSGLYAGLHVAYGRGTVNWSEVAGGALRPDGSYNVNGFLAGAQVGANWQVDQFVFGAEIDASWSRISGADLFASGASTDDHSFDIDYMATLRGRAGVTFDNALVYATAGLAHARTTSTLAFDGNPAESASANHFGWTVGAGAEVLVTDDISVKLEYLYADFGTRNYDFPGFSNLDQRFNTHTIKAGLNFHF